MGQLTPGATAQENHPAGRAPARRVATTAPARRPQDVPFWPLTADQVPALLPKIIG